MLCEYYCENGTCSDNERGYNCTCPPGTIFDHALDCAGK